MTSQLPSRAHAKELAKRLRETLVKQGESIGHAQSLELVAHQHGFRDWNALFAAICNRPQNGWSPGGRVRGRYLSHPFDATVVSVAVLKPDWFRLELDLDEAVNVVTSEGFSNFRKRIRSVVGPKGHSIERTSDDAPHLEIH